MEGLSAVATWLGAGKLVMQGSNWERGVKRGKDEEGKKTERRGQKESHRQQWLASPTAHRQVGEGVAFHQPIRHGLGGKHL